MLVEYGGSRFVFPNPSDLVVLAIVSESLKVLTRFGR
jgi:hypothetical protein